MFFGGNDDVNEAENDDAGARENRHNGTQMVFIIEVKVLLRMISSAIGRFESPQ
ncbi:predicted protein [Botrytis cinerea T4]|uniref:Uncharacterized protein n=1 Tax=Botryotinia fuckeliana (strain T4) TaxID=999810 RepID=G2Y963_BOTF4|nr:predicted protein [Botrytis cinerea T4]